MEEYFKTHSTKEIVNSFIYILLSFITLMAVYTGIMYECLFHDYFIARTTLYIIYLVIIAWTALSRLIEATILKGKKHTGKLVSGGMWVFIFLVKLIEFLCRCK